MLWTLLLPVLFLAPGRMEAAKLCSSLVSAEGSYILYVPFTNNVFLPARSIDLRVVATSEVVLIMYNIS